MDEELEAEMAALIKEAEDERDSLETETETENTTSEEETSDETEGTIDDSKDKSEEIESETETETLEKEQEEEGEQKESERAAESNDFVPIDVKVGNTTVQINSQEELLAFAKKGAAGLKPEQVKSEADEFVEQANLTREDLTLLADAKAGDPKAIAKLAAMSKVDVLDITEAAGDEYKPSFEPVVQSEVEAVAGKIMQDEPHAMAFKEAVADVPKEFAKAISSDATLLGHFSDQVRSGLAQKIIPEALKQTSLNGGDFFSNYVRIGREIYNTGKEQKPEPKKRVVTDREKSLRDKANPGNNNQAKPKTSADDIWELSDEDFAKGDFGDLRK